MPNQKQQVVVIHGGNVFERYEDYLDDLRSWEVSLEKLEFRGWEKKLGRDLGENFHVLYPQMPNSKNARYLEWKIYFEKLLPLLDENVIFIGKSLGGIFLAKYLSENDYPKSIKAILLVAAPFDSEEDDPLLDFTITNNLEKFAKQGGQIFIFHSKDDNVASFSNCESYKRYLPNAKIMVFEDRGHFRQIDFPEIVEVIKAIK